MLQFASQLVDSALTMAKQLWGTKTINTDSMLHPEPTCSLLWVPHREATPTSPITITVHVHTQRHAHVCKHKHTSPLFHMAESWANLLCLYLVKTVTAHHLVHRAPIMLLINDNSKPCALTELSRWSHSSQSHLPTLLLICVCFTPRRL